MLQFFFTGAEAIQAATGLTEALRLQCNGFILRDFAAEGPIRGQALQLLGTGIPEDSRLLPCTVAVAGVLAPIPAAARAAAPWLRQGVRSGAPLLLAGLSEPLVNQEAFGAAAQACLRAPQLCVCAVLPGAETAVRALTPPEEQLWIAADDAAEAIREALPEAKERLMASAVHYHTGG